MVHRLVREIKVRPPISTGCLRIIDSIGTDLICGLDNEDRQAPTSGKATIAVKIVNPNFSITF
jgi:hypothetical protein